jgi:IS605 OrfB family transposase
LNKAAKVIIDHCLDRQIGKLIVGYNPGIKQEIKIGRTNNQNFVQIPFWQLRRKLEALCLRYGITYQEQEESYSSKASFYDQDEIPVYNADNPSKHNFSGRRIKRGLYKTKNNHLVSSDINGSANILVKSMHRLDFQRVSSGFLANPLRMNIS